MKAVIGSKGSWLLNISLVSNCDGGYQCYQEFRAFQIHDYTLNDIIDENNIKVVLIYKYI